MLLSLAVSRFRRIKYVLYTVHCVGLKLQLVGTCTNSSFIWLTFSPRMHIMRVYFTHVVIREQYKFVAYLINR